MSNGLRIQPDQPIIRLYQGYGFENVSPEEMKRLVNKALSNRPLDEERLKLVEKTGYHKGWVSRPSQFKISMLESVSKSRCRSRHQLVNHMISLHILVLELTNKTLQLPWELQEKLKGYWKYKDFPEWYSHVMSRDMCYYYDIWEEWASLISYHGHSEIGKINLPANPTRETGILKAWDYGMCGGIYGGYPCEWSPMQKHFTKFQSYVFKRIKTCGEEANLISLADCTVMEIEGRKSRSPHYLLRFLMNYDYFGKDPISRRQLEIKNLAEARAREIFYIYEYIKQYQKIDFLIFKVGFTTVIITKAIQSCFSKSIESSDSIQDYLSQIEGGQYLSSNGQDFLWDNMMD